MEEVRNTKPYNNIDACSKQHDLDYLEASKEKDPEKKAKLIRQADDKVINCYNKHSSENGYTAAKLGIGSKISLEDWIPMLIKAIAPNYFGKK